MRLNSIILYVFVLLGLISCENKRTYILSDEQKVLQQNIRGASAFNDLLQLHKEIVISNPDSLTLGNNLIVCSNSKGFVLFDDIGKQIIMINNNGEIVRKIGKNGEGPGEFRGIKAACVDFNDNMYIYDEILAKITVYNPNGKAVRLIKVKSNINIKHMCVNLKGMIFLHKLPTKENNYYVNIIDNNGNIASLIEGNESMLGYYYRGFLGGNIIALKNGDVVETNTYSFLINRINDKMKVNTFGEEPEYYKELSNDIKYSTPWDKIKEMYSEHTECLQFLCFNNENNIVRFNLQRKNNLNIELNEAHTIASITAEVYDLNGNYIGSIKHNGQCCDFNYNGNLVKCRRTIEGTIDNLSLLAYRYKYEK